ncbi:MAG: hypothetical protein HGA87_00500 [Desulfobulbaceae bacterium]|nr:hypothetical protein [Desulfobulbaceae bacterium]
MAVADPPYALAQDVASAIKLFDGELWFQTDKGIPYFEEILGQAPPLSLLKRYLEDAAMTVPGVTSARCLISSTENRIIQGSVEFIDEEGIVNGVSF